MSLFLAALMCVTSLVGIGTTAYAAEETDDVYLISYPRDGDSNYNAEWGHSNLRDVYKRQKQYIPVEDHWITIFYFMEQSFILS